MTYQNDPNRRRINTEMDDRPSYLGWIIGAVLMLALIIGAVAYRSGDRTNTASTNTPAASNSTTGAGSGSAPATPATPAAPAR